MACTLAQVFGLLGLGAFGGALGAIFYMTSDGGPVRESRGPDREPAVPAAEQEEWRWP